MDNTNTKKKLSFSERGKLGAKALNSDIYKKTLAAKKGAQTKLKKDPGIFIKMGSLGGTQRALNNKNNKAAC